MEREVLLVSLSNMPLGHSCEFFSLSEKPLTFGGCAGIDKLESGTCLQLKEDSLSCFHSLAWVYTAGTCI